MINGLFQGLILDILKKNPPKNIFAKMYVKMKIPPLLIKDYFKYQKEMEIY